MSGKHRPKQIKDRPVRNDFEQPIAELEAKIDELRFVSSDAEVNIGEEIARLRKELQEAADPAEADVPVRKVG